MRRAAKKDDNHNEIADALRQCGCSVLDLSGVGGGCPDMLVGRHNENILIEVKRPKAKGQQAGKLTEPQEKFLAAWKGQAYVVDSVDAALAAVGVRVNA